MGSDRHDMGKRDFRYVRHIPMTYHAMETTLEALYIGWAVSEQ